MFEQVGASCVAVEQRVCLYEVLDCMHACVMHAYVHTQVCLLCKCMGICVLACSLQTRANTPSKHACMHPPPPPPRFTAKTTCNKSIACHALQPSPHTHTPILPNPQTLQEFQPHQLAAILESAARLRFRHAHMCSAVLGAAASCTAQWQTRSLAQVIWSLGYLGHGVGPGEGPQLDRIAASVTTRLRNLLTSTDATRVVSKDFRRGPGSPVDGGGVGGGGGFVGTSQEASALTARSYSWQQPRAAQQAAPVQQQAVQRGPQAPGGLGDTYTSPPRGRTGSSSSSAIGGGVSTSSDDAGVLDNCRPALEPPSVLRDSLCRLVWGYTALGRLPNSLLRESFKLLGSVPAPEYSQPQLALLFEAGMRAQEMGHSPVETHPLMATSARVFIAEVGRRQKLVETGGSKWELRFSWGSAVG